MIRVNHMAIAKMGLVGVSGIKFMAKWKQTLLWKQNQSNRFPKIFAWQFPPLPSLPKTEHGAQQLQLTPGQVYISSNMAVPWFCNYCGMNEFCKAHRGGKKLPSTFCCCGCQVHTGAAKGGSEIWGLHGPFPSNRFYFLPFGQILLKV